MLERFTTDARGIVSEARLQATRLNHVVIGTEHILLALVSLDDATGVALRAAGLDAANVEAGIRTRLGRGPHDDDREALALLGIDLDRVNELMSANFGEDAWTPAERRRLFPLVSRRGRERSRRSRLSDRAKKCLELALREALRLNQKFIGTEHIALGLLREGRGLACGVMADLGIGFDALRHELEVSVRRAA